MDSVPEEPDPDYIIGTESGPIIQISSQNGNGFGVRQGWLPLENVPLARVCGAPVHHVIRGKGASL